ncbi:MAG: hypothetical protein ABSG41_18250 [Bryobacteraceae bacterium]
MKNAYEFREHFNGDGKCISRERAIGPIVIWAIIAIVAMATGHPLNIPSVWQYFKP